MLKCADRVELDFESERRSPVRILLIEATNMNSDAATNDGLPGTAFDARSS